MRTAAPVVAGEPLDEFGGVGDMPHNVHLAPLVDEVVAKLPLPLSRMGEKLSRTMIREKL